MFSIFARIYSTWVGILMIAGLALFIAVTLVNDFRFKRFSDPLLSATAQFVQQGYQRQDTDERRQAWLELVSTLTGTNWHSTVGRLQRAQFSDVDWVGETVAYAHPLDNRQALNVSISDWEHLATGLGLLVTNELSLVPAAQREQRLAELNASLDIDIERLGWRNEGLGFVLERDLDNGQVVVDRNNALKVFFVYVPAGSEQALRLGPLQEFVWLTPNLTLLILVGFLCVTALALWRVMQPLQHRLTLMNQAIDTIADTGEAPDLSQPQNDALTEMWHHIQSMAERLIQLAEQSQQLNQAVSHDLKTPLARMQFALAMLDPDAPLTKQLQGDVRELNQLIDELLLYHQLSQKHAGAGTHTEAVYCFVSNELSELVKRMQPGNGHIERVLADINRAGIDAHHWRRLCRNLISNALQYGRGQTRVTLSARPPHLVLTVEDDGPGFRDMSLDHAIKPFVRGDKARNLSHNGHGMGLTLVATLVRHYRGELTLGRSPLGGAAVTVSLPVLNDRTMVAP
ncbi:ATP-binding protein [Saccharospirillum impatiens]|uniref:ATP-binding protein n=1 Tax=Saccharospirillum impatiens TaxID=169438 RepID=UPI0003FC246F|nr:ATP-binding protein [Saccharospirillum impatiens]